MKTRFLDIKPHLEVSIALSYSPQRGESCSPVFRQRFGRGYAHANPKSAPPPFAIVREKQNKPLMFQSISKDYNVCQHIYADYTAVFNTNYWELIHRTSKSVEDRLRKLWRLVLMKELTEVHRSAVIKDPLVLLRVKKQCVES